MNGDLADPHPHLQGRVASSRSGSSGATAQYALLKTYEICKWSGALGPKVKEGDRQAPEGFYIVTPAQMNPNSSYYLSFNIGYPNAYDRASAAPARTSWCTAPARRRAAIR